MAKKRFDRFDNPVNIANILDSIFGGINFAKRTMLGKVTKAMYSVSVTPVVIIMNTSGFIPRISPCKKSSVPAAPKQFYTHAMTIIKRVDYDFKHEL